MKIFISNLKKYQLLVSKDAGTEILLSIPILQDLQIP